MFGNCVKGSLVEAGKGVMRTAAADSFWPESDFAGLPRFANSCEFTVFLRLDAGTPDEVDVLQSRRRRSFPDAGVSKDPGPWIDLWQTQRLDPESSPVPNRCSGKKSPDMRIINTEVR